MMNIDRIRQDFPILDQMVNGHPLVYFDNVATTQKPTSVIESMDRYYRMDNANVHRSVHELSARATASYENARKSVQRFIHAPHAHECIFVRGTTEAINLVANSYGLSHLKAGDEVLISQMEHHSNIVPWQMLCERVGAKLQVIQCLPNGELCQRSFTEKLNEKTKLLAIAYASNALGTIHPVKAMIKQAHAVGAVVLLDGAQSSAHLPIDVQDLECDFYAFSGHKMYGPTGIGVLWGREALLNAMPPYQGGGEMIRFVRFEKTDYAPLPYKFEAGTPNIAGVVGLAAAIDYLQTLPMKEIIAHEQALLDHATHALQAFPGIRLFGVVDHKVSLISFIHDTIHPHDLGTILDNQGVAVRSGHHCAMPLMDYLKVPATVRLSLAFYNTHEEIDHFVRALHYACQVFQ